MLACQRYCVTLQLLDTEQLRAQQLGIALVAQRTAYARRNPELSGDYEILLARTSGDPCSTGLMKCVCLRLVAQVFRPVARLLPAVIVAQSRWCSAVSAGPRGLYYAPTGRPVLYATAPDNRQSSLGNDCTWPHQWPAVSACLPDPDTLRNSATPATCQQPPIKICGAYRDAERAQRERASQYGYCIRWPQQEWRRSRQRSPATA